MDKKVEINTKKKKYDDIEDLDIKEVAYTKSRSQTVLFYILVILFIFMLSVTAIKIVKKNFSNNKNREILEVTTNRNRVVIVNNGEIEQPINKNIFKNSEQEIVMERINSIELVVDKNAKDKAKVLYDVKYNISKNPLRRNLYSNINSEVLVKFSYSRDNKDWTYINNVISTPESTISPLIGNSYDIAGVEANLKVITNMQLESEKNASNKIYWRSETIFKNIDAKNIDDLFKANFKIEYKEWN